jgi:hypothetical protein
MVADVTSPPQKRPTLLHLQWGEELGTGAGRLPSGLFGGSRMTRLSVLAFAAIAVVTMPASAEPGGVDPSNSLSSISRIIGEPPTPIERRGFSFPVVEYRGPDGVVQQRRGVIAGTKVAPGTVLGVGIYETAPKMRGYVGDMMPQVTPRKSRRAAVGLKMKF